MTGCLLINKNPGTSSFESLRPIKKALETPKVCHTGTLDSFAQGLLVVLTGRAVKLSSFFTGCGKQYRALLRFGEETSTLDPEGEVIASAPIPGRAALEAILPAFTGTIEQAPPLYSAVHINGRRAHELARAGEVIEMKKRPVTIFSLSLVSWASPHAELEVHCSSGTYIRSLARDLAIALGSRAHLRSLIRTKVGDFEINNALSLPMEAGRDPSLDIFTEKAVKSALLPLNPVLFQKLGIPSVSIDEQSAGIVSHGGDLGFLRIPEPGNIQQPSSPVIALFCHDSLAAVIEKKDGLWKYRFVHAAD